MQVAGQSVHRGWHSRGYLPHFDSPETVQHIVFRTRDSFPQAMMASLPDDGPCRRRLIDTSLDAGFGCRPLLDGFNASTVENALLHFDGMRYHLLAWCIMPNHVHVVVCQMQANRPGVIVRSWKGFSARQINLAAGTRGAFWAPEFFDRFMRHETQLNATIAYVEQNPVAAGLVKHAGEWRYSSARLRSKTDCAPTCGD